MRADGGRGDVRVGDRERAEAAERLAAHAAAGRLTVEELEERVERAHAAVFARELAAVEADLPLQPGGHERRGRGPDVVPRSRRTPLWLAPAIACLVAAVLLTAVVGHPVVPLFLFAALLWRAGRHALRPHRPASA